MFCGKREKGGKPGLMLGVKQVRTKVPDRGREKGDEAKPYQRRWGERDRTRGWAWRGKDEVFEI